MRNLTKTYKALANERRLKILNILLEEGELNVSDIASRIRLSHRSTSKHLILLEKAGFLKYRYVALHCFYSLNKTPQNKVFIDALKQS